MITRLEPLERIKVRQSIEFKPQKPHLVNHYKIVYDEVSVLRLRPDEARQAAAETKRLRKRERRAKLGTPRYHPQFLRQVGKRKKATPLPRALSLYARRELVDVPGREPMSVLSCPLWWPSEKVLSVGIPRRDLYNGQRVFSEGGHVGIVQGGVNVERYIDFGFIYLPFTEIFWRKEVLRRKDKTIMQVA